MEIWPGQPFPLGATFDGMGTNFCMFSEVASRVELCLFDKSGVETRVDLPEATGFCWHGYMPRVKAGQRYGYRVHGPWDPRAGHRCNPSKLLLDPYSKAVDGTLHFDHSMLAHDESDPLLPSSVDSAPSMGRSVVTAGHFDWGDDRRLNTPWEETILYELHVKGFTARHPEIPEELRGTFAGLAHPAAVKHLTDLGVTGVELMPVHQFVHDRHVTDRGKRNYWGYNSIAYLAPHNEYAVNPGAPEDAVSEFKHLVKTMHAAGIEVIIDVVYNHTGEGDEDGPTMCLRGIDNQAYYRLDADDSSKYIDYTGCGNSLNMRHPRVLQLIMDSLRYWVTEMHVDGFRFDLASTLARELHDVDRLSAFFDLIQQDPVISRTKLIAEPWDVGEGGYQVGNFPPLWSEWNGKYRDCVRDFWRGEPSTLGEFASRFTGSADLYEGSGRRPYASINFVTAHDGFTLRDLVSYSKKHNLDNGEDNNDGESHNRSWNCGHEGPTDDPGINELRRRQQRNFLATLLVSQGVPMLSHGDELGRTQRGNNNGYCQDNELTWIDWDNIDRGLLTFTRRVIRLRRLHPAIKRRHFFSGDTARIGGLPDIVWFTHFGEEMDHAHWGTEFARAVAVFINGHGVRSVDQVGRPIVDDHFLVLLSADAGPLEFKIPDLGTPMSWSRILDTGTGAVGTRESELALPFAPGDHTTLVERSVQVLRNTTDR